jgi:hypothetical protein
MPPLESETSEADCHVAFACDGITTVPAAFTGPTAQPEYGPLVQLTDSTRRNTCPTTTTSHTQTALGNNPGLQGEQQVTNRVPTRPL